MKQDRNVILVTGATGTVGRHLVDQLLQADQNVRALSRSPAAADLPDAVEVVSGDLTAPETLVPALDGVTGMHLIPIGGDDYTPLQTAPEIIELATEAGVQRVTVLTGTEDELAVVKAVEAAGIEWTHLRPAEFMANALEWAESIRREREVKAAFSDKPRAMIHEADIAAVAVTALLEEGNAGQTYRLTGPESLTRIEAIRTIGEEINRDIRFVELTPEQAREQMRALGIREEVIENVIEYESDPPEEAYTVLPTVEQVTDQPPRTFSQWTAEHAEAFL